MLWQTAIDILLNIQIWLETIKVFVIGQILLAYMVCSFAHMYIWEIVLANSIYIYSQVGN